MIDRSPFVLRLEQLRDAEDRAALARLRRGLGQAGGCIEMYRYVVPYLPEDERQVRWYFLVGSLFGLHPQRPTAEGDTIGTTLARLRDQGRSSESLEERFIALLNAHADDLAEHLRHVVSLARSHGIGIDYHRLLFDLARWSHPERFIQLHWARDYWGQREADETASTHDTDSPESTAIGGATS